MRIVLSLIALFFLLLYAPISTNAQSTAQISKDMMLWYNKPASTWEECLPLGNGSLGAMVMGGVHSEHIFLNESSVWSGQYYFTEARQMPEVLPKIRNAIFEGDHLRADSLTSKFFTTKNDPRYGCYQPLGDLYLDFTGIEDTVLSYKRTLDLNTATSSVSFRTPSATFRREIFISRPDQSMVLKLSCSKRNNLSFTMRLDRERDALSFVKGRDGLILYGKCDNGGSAFYGRARVVAQGGKLYASDGKLTISHADKVFIYFTARTSYWKKDQKRECDSIIRAVCKKSYKTLLTDHVKDYRHYFKRVELNLGKNMHSDLPTDERIRSLGADADPNLTALLFQFGRYLLISSSRPGGLPANLQGIWNKDFRPPWFSDFTININLQMNYWPAEVCNLTELNQPLFDQIMRMYPAGKRSAKERYGCGGWELSTRSTPWGVNELRGQSSLLFQESAAWLCTHLWEHYLYTGDQKFLKKYYPLIRDAALFYNDYLVMHPRLGYLVAGPTTSPENFFTDPEGKNHAVTMGTTLSTQIVHDIFTICAESAGILGVDPELCKQLLDKRSKLLPMRVGSKGQLLEWAEEYREPEPQHRHISHLYGLFPGNQINTGHPELLDAARKTLEIRGDGGTGWSIAWKICFWARLRDGDHADRMIRRFFTLKSPQATDYKNAGGMYPNMFCSHPPFQIDGNFGITAGIAEMLLQSQDNEVALLSALPQAWKNGEVKGLRARGGLTVSIHWKDHKLQDFILKAKNSGNYTVSYGLVKKTIRLIANQAMFFGSSLMKPDVPVNGKRANRTILKETANKPLY